MNSRRCVVRTQLKKTRQIKTLQSLFNSIEPEKALVGVGFVPSLKIFLPRTLLFLFDRPFPGLVCLFVGSPVRPLARVVGGLGLAHGHIPR